MGVTDLLIPLGHGSLWNDNELRYALRSWAMHYPLVDPLVIGRRPSWYTGRFLRMDEHGTLNQNTHAKLLHALDHVGSTFIYSADDIYLLDTPRWGTFHQDTPPNRAMYYRKQFPGGRDHELHIPVLFDRERLREVLKTGTGAIRTRYFQQDTESTLMQDVKVKGIPEGGWCFSSMEGIGYQTALKAWLQEGFPEGSSWERTLNS